MAVLRQGGSSVKGYRCMGLGGRFCQNHRANGWVRAKKRSCNVGTGPRFPLAEVLRTMNLERLDALETIDPSPLAPWDPPVFEDINIDLDRDEAEKKAMALMETPGIVIYSDASADQNCLGAAAVILDRDQMIIEHQKVSIGPKSQWSIHAGCRSSIVRSLALSTA